ncbi:MAG: Activator of Hsp90 ATPase 1 family protein [Actinomycetia bacterium]|jgi:uncharacterized protein YndB with AHSA1/START domain|nr:Activator of Hsp90 ATPase 1 family protein [Actinomycetes bacterium]
MTDRSSLASPVTAAADDYTYEMRVRVPLPQIVAALTDDTLISRWWTAVTGSERHDDEVQLFIGGDAPFVFFTVEHAPETNQVTWTVTDCAVMADWVGTKPSFSVRPNADGTSTIEFRHVGLGPALECFDQCRAGWNHFMPSLYQFLETGVGRPNEPRDASA